MSTLARSRWGRLRYQVYRHPIILFAVGPAYLFIIQHRLPVGLMRGGWGPWLSAMATNVAITTVVATIIWLVGVGPFLLVQMPIILLAASAGVWLFYVQHQFENTEWARDGTWNLQDVALHGSSHYALPGLLRWFTANIGIHHIHHLCSQIPCYRLPLVLRDHPELTASADLRCFRVSGVCNSCCGTKVNNGSSHSVRCVSIVLRFKGRPAHCTAGNKMF